MDGDCVCLGQLGELGNKTKGVADMSENDQVMLYRNEVEMLLRHLREIQDLYRVDHDPKPRKALSLREHKVLSLLHLWIERLHKVLEWR